MSLKLRALWCTASAILLNMILLLRIGFGEDKHTIVIEFYFDGPKESYREAVEAVNQIVDKRGGLEISWQDVSSNSARLKLAELKKYFKVSEPKFPFVYTCNAFEMGCKDQSEFSKRIENMLRVDIFSKNNCAACTDVPQLITELAYKYPGLVVSPINASDKISSEYLDSLVKYYRKDASQLNFPIIHCCNSLADTPQGKTSATLWLDKRLETWVKK